MSLKVNLSVHFNFNTSSPIHKAVITARKRSLGQGNIFTPVCHSVQWGHAWLLWGGMHGCSGGGHVWLLRGACMVAQGGMHGCSRGVCMVAPGGMGGVHGCSGGMRGCSGGACMVLFGVGGQAWFYSGGHGFIWGVHSFIQGACMVLFGGASMVFSVFSDTMRYGQWAGGTHPTGMHSC